jgi:hypothetical protein
MRNVTGVTGAAPIWNTFMEAVLADPELLATLGAPEEPAAWEFEAPAGIVTAPVACPTGIQCTETEIFSQRWLERMGELGPLGDSIIAGNMRTVYVNRGNGARALGACSAGDGATRQLVRMPFGLTRSLPLVAPELLAQAGTSDPLALTLPASESTAPAGSLGAALDTNLDTEQLRRIREEQSQAMQWSGRNNSVLYLGPCEEAEQIARFMFDNALRSVSVGGAGEQIVVERQETEQEEEQEENDFVVDDSGGGALAAAAPPVVVGGAASSRYAPLGVAHDANCGANRVMGQVVNASGQAVPGIAVTYSDQFGNVSQTSTSSAAQGYGSFSFPVMAPDQSHTIYISVAGGTSSATVPHRQGGSSDQGCHYVIWRGTD